MSKVRDSIWFLNHLANVFCCSYEQVCEGLFFLLYKIHLLVDPGLYCVQVQTFLAALRALSRREVQYGSYATSEEVSAWTI